MSWETVSIGDICDVKGGKRLPKGHDYSPEPTPYRYIRVADINDGKIDVASLNYLYPETHEKISKYIVNTGDVIISIAGTIGVTVPVTNELDGINLTENAAKLVPKEKDIYDPYYLSLVFQSPYVQHQISGLTGQVTIGKLALFRIKEIEVPLPPLGEQRRIAAVLDKADALRQKRRAALAKLDTLLQATFLHMFGDPVTNPMGWEKRPISEVAKVKGGLQLSGKRKDYPIEVPYLRVANVYRDYLKMDEIKTLRVNENELERTSLVSGDILLVEGHGNSEEIGRTAVWNGSINPCVHQNHLIRVQTNRKKILPIYMSHYLNSQGGRRQLVQAGKTTSGLNTISSGQVRQTNVLVPPIEIQQKYLEHVELLQKLKETHQRNLTHLDNLFHALQQRAFNGQL